ncbi:MAG: helix-turn-helix domain-containing protein, partial [Elusimicrobia bacterium]|nr:helix-turn-helix domain-containing protein [Elusimicrobiota bacterium]
PTLYLIPQAAAAVGFGLVDAYVWHKPNAVPFAPARRLKSAYEILWHFAKSKDYFFDKDSIREPHLWAGRDNRPEKYHPLGKDPGNIFTLPKSQDQSSFHHPGKMVEGLASKFIRLLSRPGDLVADGFAGTGQTGVEALALDRRFIGYELHAERTEQARRRLGVEEADMTNKQWLNAKEAGEYLGLSQATIYSKTSRKEIPAHKQGRIVRYDRNELDAWLRGGPAGAAVPGAAK